MKINISDELHSILGFAADEAMRTGSYGIGPDHIFLGLLRETGCAAFNVLSALGINPSELKEYIDDRIFTNERIPFGEAGSITLSRESQNLLSITVLEATRFLNREATSLHLLLALCRMTGSYGYRYIQSKGVGAGDILTYMKANNLLMPEEDADGLDSMAQETPGASDNAGKESDKSDASPEAGQKPGDRTEGGAAAGQSCLEYCCRDLTAAVRNGECDPVVGREQEIGRIIRILGRRRKNNAILVGDPGVGKTAIVEKVAEWMSRSDVPPQLRGKRILSLDMAAVVAGTRFRGDFEKRLKGIIDELRNDRNTILFIDEFHTVIGAGNAGSGLDAANILKPALSGGDIQVIAAAGADEFSRTVEKDPALYRRFQKVTIEPAGVSDTLEILGKLKPYYEVHHRVEYADDALEACVRLSERYITDRRLPDKAIDVMDEAGSMVRMGSGRRLPEVNAGHIAEVVSQISGIPVTKVAESESSRLLKMGERLRRRIVGQDEAVDTIVKAIRRGRSGVKDPDRPIGSFLFFGQTGVGKTLLAKALAEEMFGSGDNLIRLDMSEYLEKFTASRLVGAPPGYVGFEEGGQLTEAVRRKPYSVILLDEIEKAHPDVFNMLLQVLDEGRLTDSSGRTVNFRNTILIMTSNVGGREVSEYGAGLGFGTVSRDVGREQRNIIRKAVKRVFPPEFINRIDEMIFFRPLDREDMSRIIDIELKNLRGRLRGEGIEISISPEAKRFVAEEGYDPSYGARPLKRAMRRLIEDPVAEELIRRCGSRVPGREDSEKGKSPQKISLKMSKDHKEIVAV